MRAAASLLTACFLALGSAPLQCGGSGAELQRRDTPEEALYELAQRFERAGDRGAAAETRRYLVEQYPNSRFASRARLELAEKPDDASRGGAP
jgi:outer membrane protein assembly factor BamD (BamD/ComL family)